MKYALFETAPLTVRLPVPVLATVTDCVGNVEPCAPENDRLPGETETTGTEMTSPLTGTRYSNDGDALHRAVPVNSKAASANSLIFFIGGAIKRQEGQ